MFDDKIFGINPDDKVALARAAAGEVMGKNDRIISERPHTVMVRMLLTADE